MPNLEKFSPFPPAMLDNAGWQVEQHQDAAGIILAQVAVEMAATDAFTALFVLEDEIGRSAGRLPSGLGAGTLPRIRSLRRRNLGRTADRSQLRRPCGPSAARWSR